MSLIALLCILYFPNSSFSQNDLSSKINITDTNTIELDATVKVNKIMKMDNSMLLIGHKRNSGDIDGFVAKVDNKGARENTQIFGVNSKLERFSKSVTYREDHVLVLSNEVLGGVTSNVIYELDSNLNLVDKFEVFKGRDWIGEDMILSNDSILYIAYWNGINKYRSFPGIMKINLNTKSKKQVDFDSKNASPEEKIDELIPEEYKGNKEAEESYASLQEYENNKFEKYVAKLKIHDNILYCIGQEGTRNVSDYWVGAADSELNILWEQLYETESGSYGADWLKDIHFIQEEIHLFGLEYNKSLVPKLTGANYQLVKTNRHGISKDRIRYDFGEHERLAGVIPFQDSYLMYGYKYPFRGDDSKQNLFLVLIDKDGTVLSKEDRVIQGLDKITHGFATGNKFNIITRSNSETSGMVHNIHYGVIDKD